MEIRNIIIFAIFVFGLVYMQLIRAHPVKDIIRKYIEAREVLQKLQSVQSVYLEGVREMMGNKVFIKITRVHGKLYRNDFEFGNMSGYTIVIPGGGWYFIPGHSTMPAEIPLDRLQMMQAELDVNGPLVDYADKGTKADLEGKEDISGREAYRVKLMLRDGSDIICFIDTKTYLLVQTRQVTTDFNIAGIENASTERELVTNYSDYKLAGGIMFPHIISNPAGINGGGTLTINKIEVNKVIDDSQYLPSM